MQLTQAKANAELEKYKEKWATFKAKHQKGIETAGKGAKTFGRAAIAGGTAWGLGYANKRFDTTEVMGVPIDLGAGILALGASVLVKSPTAAYALESVGIGATCAFAHTLGMGAGREAREKDAEEVEKEKKK